jgi:hypothetical protein
MLFLGEFTKLLNATISFIMPVRPSVRLEQLGCHWMDFHENRHLSIFWKYVEKMQVSLKHDKNKEYFTWRPMYIFYNISLNFSRTEKIFHMKVVVDKIKTHILCSITSPPPTPENRRLRDNVEQYCRAGLATIVIRRMRFVCWRTVATNTHSDYVILIAFPR